MFTFILHLKSFSQNKTALYSSVETCKGIKVLNADVEFSLKKHSNISEYI